VPEPVARLESGCPQIVLDVLGQIREGLRVFDEPERFVCLFAVVGEAPKLSGPAVQGEGGIRGLAGALGALEIPGRNPPVRRSPVACSRSTRRHDGSWVLLRRRHLLFERTGTVRPVPVLHLVQAAGSDPSGARLPRTPRSPSRTVSRVLREVVEARRVAHRHALDEVADVVGAGRRGRRGAAAGRRWRCRWTQGPTALRSALAEPTPQPLPGDRRAHLRGHWPARDRDPIDEKTMINRSVTEPTAPPRR
jgi:hypothetical protein